MVVKNFFGKGGCIVDLESLEEAGSLELCEDGVAGEVCFFS